MRLVAIAVLSLVCLAPPRATGQTQKASDDLVGAWRGKVTLTSGAFAPLKDLVYMYCDGRTNVLGLDVGLERTHRAGRTFGWFGTRAEHRRCARLVEFGACESELREYSSARWGRPVLLLRALNSRWRGLPHSPPHGERQRNRIGRRS